MSDLMRLVCEMRGHVPRDTDPTGGAPWMGGPVAITICDRCERELPHSEAAQEFNRRVMERHEKAAAEERARHWSVPTRRWTRKQRCACGWSGRNFTDHIEAAR